MTARSGDDFEHITRLALPWREGGALTECGLVAEGRRTITASEFVTKVKLQGLQRAGMSTCMTCWNTAERWQGRPGFGRQRFVEPADDLVSLMGREVDRCLYNKDDRIREELAALALLVEAHRDEFDEILAARETVDLNAQRRKRSAPKERGGGVTIR